MSDGPPIEPLSPRRDVAIAFPSACVIALDGAGEAPLSNRRTHP